MHKVLVACGHCDDKQARCWEQVLDKYLQTAFLPQTSTFSCDMAQLRSSTKCQSLSGANCADYASLCCGSAVPAETCRFLQTGFGSRRSLWHGVFAYTEEAYPAQRSEICKPSPGRRIEGRVILHCKISAELPLKHHQL